jgi:hypothetical protein
MEAAIRELMGAGTPPRFKFQDTYESIEFPSGYTIPAQATLEAKYDELLALEEDIQKAVVEGDLEVGTSNLFVDTETGDVGIGTNSPGFSLDVHGTANVGALTATSLSGDGSGLTSLDADNLTSGTVSSDRLSLIASDIPSLDAGKITSGTLGRPISTTTGVFTSTGNAVLVGPSGGGQVGLTINDGDGNTNITFNHASVVPDQNGSSGRIDCGVDGTSAYMRLRVKDNVTGGTNTGNLPDCVRIEEGYVRAYSNLYVGGNFGIGTTSPGYKLDVHGSSNVGALTTTSVSGDGSGLTSLDAGNISSGTINKDRLPTTLNNTTIGSLAIGANDVTLTAKVDYHGLKILKAFDSPNEPATLLLAGDGDTGDDIAFEIRGNGTGSDVDTTTTRDSDDTTFGILHTGHTYIGYPNLNPGETGGNAQSGDPMLNVAGDIYATGNVAAYSDKRAKSDIKKIENALDKIDQLNGYTFTMNDKRYTGVIAQEVLPVLPEAVTGSEETNYAVAYGNMMGLVIEAIKEIKEKIG